jgi:hypothetical protein
MFIPTGSAQVNFIFDGPGYARGAQVTLGVDNNLDDLDAADIAGAVGGLWVARLSPLQTSTINLASVKAKKGPNSTGAEADVPFGVAGSLSSQPLPPQDCGLINKITAAGGRHGRGRMFFPGMVEAQTDGGGLVRTADILTFNTHLSDFFDDLHSAHLDAILLHSDTTAPTAITGFVMQQLMATQRRRIRKVGGRRHT